MKRILNSALFATTGLLCLMADLDSAAPWLIGLGRSAQAFVGAPLTPFSGAGVARRTTRRIVAAEAATMPPQQIVVIQQAPGATMALGSAVATLPDGCTSLQTGGVQYKRCGDDYYRATFQGNNLVYIVVPRP